MVVQVHILSCHHQLGIMDSKRLNSVVILENRSAEGLSMLFICMHLHSTDGVVDNCLVT